MNNNAMAGRGCLLYGYSASPLDRNYSNCVFINNEYKIFAVNIKIDFYDSIFENDPLKVVNENIKILSGCSVNVTNPMTIEIKSCQNKNPEWEKWQKWQKCKMTGGVEKMYRLRKIRWFSIFVTTFKTTLNIGRAPRFLSHVK
jgi:hypothetical protein